MKISASIVLYNVDCHILETAVESFSPNEHRKLYLIDNSKNRTDIHYLTDRFSNIEYVFTGTNLGYGSAHNIALKMAIQDLSTYHLILNPDIRFKNTILSELVEYLENNEDVIYLLPKVIYPNGELQYLCKLLPTPIDLLARRFLLRFKFAQRIENRFVLKDSGYNRIINPPCLSGCFMFLRLSEISKNNLFFDERFFMYFEDFDLIRRCHRIGKTVFYPKVTIIHDHNRQAYTSKKMFFIFVISMIKYFNKYSWFFDAERKAMNDKILKKICYNTE